MPAIRKKSGTKKTVQKKTTHSGKKNRTVRHRKTSTPHHAENAEHATIHHKEFKSETYVFECTRPGCGYHLWHDEKHEPGQVRLDMKCPKCHNYGFKCLGKGDVPETFQVPINTEPLDLNNISSTELGSSY